MRRVLWAVWIYALVYNAYVTWIWGNGLPRSVTEGGLPTSLYALRFYAVTLGPIVSVVALVWTVPWRSRLKHWN
jgi:hypothetical protein